MMPTNPFQHERHKAEEVHQLFYKLHWQFVAAGDVVQSILLKLHAAEVKSYADNGRDELRDLIAESEALRDMVSALLRKASGTRTDMIRLTGCDASCETSSAEPSATPPQSQEETK